MNLFFLIFIINESLHKNIKRGKHQLIIINLLY